jgi:phenylpropionate dioxygenase-like ring-hydroxylating dioxygenase large terminal subunit
MNSDYFIPVLTTQSLRLNKPVAVRFRRNKAVVLKTEKGIFAYEDFCPHRGLALSEGYIKDGQIHCRYHGWQFDCENGINTFVPVKNEAVFCQLKPYFVLDKYGIVWLSDTNDAVIPSLASEIPTATLQGTIKANITNVLENFLEGSHTHYVHDGLIRSMANKRNPIKALLTNTDRGFQVCYDSEPSKGLVTKLLPKKLQELKSVSTYIHPDIAILEFFNPQQQLIARFEAILTQENEQVKYLGRIFVYLGWITAFIQPILKMIFTKIIEQDKQILELQEQNLAHFIDRTFISDDTDVVGTYIYAWQNQQAGKMPDSVTFKVYW